MSKDRLAVALCAAVIAVLALPAAASAAPPANDNIGTATVITGAAPTATGTNVEATTEPGEPDHLVVSSQVSVASVWYEWTAPASEQMEFETCLSDFDTVLAVYTGGPAMNSLVRVAHNDDTTGCGVAGRASTLKFDATAGVTYRIAVAGFPGGTQAGSVSLVGTVVEPAENDDFADAEAISSGTTSDEEMDGASHEVGEPKHAEDYFGNPEGSLWWNFTAPSSGTFTISTCVSDPDTLLAVYTGSAVDSLTRVAANNNGPHNCGTAGRSSRVVIDATAGQLYRIAVDANGDPVGTVRLRIDPGGIVPPPTDDIQRETYASFTDSVTGTNVGATRQSIDPEVAGLDGEASVHYQWTSPGPGQATCEVCGASFDTLLRADGEGGQVAGNDDACGAGGSRVTIDVGAGETILLMVASKTGTTGSFTLSSSFVLTPPPPNDDIGDAVTLTGVDVTQSGTTSGATRESGEPDLIDDTRWATRSSVWYRWTAPRTAKVTLDTCASSTDTVLGVYPGTDFKAARRGYNDDALGQCSTNQRASIVEWDATAGQTYMIAVDGHPSSRALEQGPFTLHLVQAEGPGLPAPQKPTPRPQPPRPQPRPPVTTPRGEPGAPSFALREGRLRAALNRGVRPRLTCEAACEARFELVMSRREARRLKIRGRGKQIRVGRAAVKLTGAGTRTVAVKLNAKTRRRLRRVRSARMTLRVTLTDHTGRSVTSRRKLWLRH